MNLNLNLNLQQSTTKSGLSRISLVKSQSSGKLSFSNETNDAAPAAPTATATTTTTSLRAAKLKIEAMQQQQQQKGGGSGGNIILLRGTRNENGQIIIQNKQDILSLLSEQQQQQQQQQDKATAITLNQLPTTTTVARKTIVQGAATSSGTGSSISIVSSGGKETNTILLQTPINASQLESVLKAQNTAATATVATITAAATTKSNAKLIERPFMLKHASRSLSSESNCDSKSPFVLQTLKRLEKSQSILVIRNSTSTATSTATAATSTAMATSPSQTQHVLSLTRSSKTPKAVAAALQKLKATPAVAAATKTTTTATVAAAAGAGAAATAGGTTILRLGKKQVTTTTSVATTTTAATTAASTTTGAATAAVATSNKLSTTSAMEQNVPLGSDGEPIKLPDNLESLPRADSFPSQRHRWNTNEEIAAILISFDKHSEWQSKEVKTRPKSGSLLLYSRKKVRYRRDGYCWKKRKDGKTTREDHMKLKVQGTECIYGCYVHSAILPTFHRRCYWLLQNPDIVLVHYLNVPYPDDNKMAVIAPSITLWGDKKEWTKEELVSQLKPMLSTVNSDEDSDSGNDIEISTAETVESIVCQLMEKQRLSRQAALVKQLDCGCGDAACADGKTCTHPVMRRTGILKSVSEKRSNDAYSTQHSGSNGTPNVVVASKLYSRWSERHRQREAAALHLENSHGQYHNATQQLPQESAIKFQIIPQQQQQQQQHPQQQQQQVNHSDGSNYQQQYRGGNQMLATRSNLIIQQQQQQYQQQQQQQQQQHLNLQRFVASHNQSNQSHNHNSSNSNNNSSSSSNNNPAHLNHRLQIANTTITATTREAATTAAGTASNSMETELIENQSQHLTANANSGNKISHNSNNCSSSSKQLTAASAATTTATAQTNNELNVVNNNGPNSSSSNNFMYNQQQQQVNASSNSSSTQQQHYYKLQQTTPSSNTSQPPVEAMCMSPEHHPSSNSSSSGSGGSNSNTLNNNNNQLTATTSSAGNNNNNTPSTSATSSTSSSLQSIIDGNQQQQITTTTTAIGGAATVASSAAAAAVAAAATTAAANCDNLMSANALAELELGEQQQQQQQQQQAMSNYSSSSNNNQAGDAHNNNKVNNGCATYSASSDNSSQISANSDNDSSYSANSSSNNSNSNNNNQSTHNEDEAQTDAMSFFNETLDLSHEDIQRTLIANMPYTNSNGGGGTAATGAAVSAATSAVAAATVAIAVAATTVSQEEQPQESTDEDTADVFANLDAFDMLVEFPELDLDDKQALSNTALEQEQAHHAAAAAHQQPQRKLHQICDFSPEWSYTEGGVKVLVAGPWTSDGGCYTVLFDAQPVPTVLVQEGVLRCYCPAHEAGVVTLQVACGGFLVSNSAMFEYKLSLLADAPFDASSSNDCLYKFTLLNRLSTIDEKLQLKVENELTTDQTSLYLEPNFEEKLVAYCHKLMKHAWSAPSTVTSWSVGLRGMTLLHLAAALGYAKLVGAMLNWRAENPHIILETELDALSQDVHGFTPLAWACVRGHLECTLLLYKWNHNALKIKTQAQQTPMDLASLKGHKQLLAQLYRLEKERCRKPHPRGGLANLSMNPLGIESAAATVAEAESGYSIYELELQRRHDGVFLRPVPLHSNQSPPNNSSRYSKRSSIDSGINMDMRGKSSKPLARLHGTFDVHDNYSLGGVDSPLDSLTGNNCSGLLSPLRKMDFALCEVSTGESSPIHDKDIIDCDDNDSTSVTIDATINNDLNDAVVGDSDAKVLTLAEHIIAAMPERIKNEADEMMVLGSPLTEPLTSESSALTDSFMDPLLDSLPNTHFDSDFSFDFHDHSYRYHDVSTPCSSLSPASSGPLQSPASYSILGTDPSVSSPSPPPSTKQLTEFLHASSISQYPFEADFSKLTLTDTEQRELYEAAKCIQKAYRMYKGRQKLEEQNKERTAAIVIQNYYRRYKQYAYYRQMTNAALVIQHGYRSYRRNKRFKKSQHTPSGLGTGSEHGSVSSNSQCLSSFYDNYKQDQQQQIELSSQPSTPKETSPSGPLKRTYSQSTQNQAARKIQQFMRQSRIKLQRERAEKEKLVHQRRAEYLQNLQFQGQQEMSVCHNESSVGNNNLQQMQPNQ